MTLGTFSGLLAVVVLLLLVMVLVIAESALSATSTVRIASLEDESERRRSRVTRLLEEPQNILNPLRLVILLMHLAEASVVALLAAQQFGRAGVALVLVLNGCLLFVVAEAVPRTLGILHADRAALALAGPVAFFVGFGPVRLVARFLIGLSNVIVPGKGIKTGPFSLPEELIALADAAFEDDVLEESERDLIESVIEFGETIVREVMIPRTDMTTIEANLSVAGALEITSQAGFSRVPVTGENIDDIVGLAYVKDLIRAELDDRDDAMVGELLRPPRFVPETKKVAPLLREMQRDSFHMAVVVDEYGGIAGLVTLEDLIEEIVGEIVDEYDVEEQLVERQPDGTLRVDGRMLIDELNDLAGLELPSGDWDTVGGLVFDQFGRVPREGETRDCDGYVLLVERVQGRRITRVRILQVDGGPTSSVPQINQPSEEQSGEPASK